MNWVHAIRPLRVGFTRQEGEREGGGLDEGIWDVISCALFTWTLTLCTLQLFPLGGTGQWGCMGGMFSKNGRVAGG